MDTTPTNHLISLRTCSRAAVFFALLASCGGAAAATLYFDPTGTTTLGGSGTFSAQTTALYSSTAAGGGTLVAAMTTDSGVFQGNAGTITFSSAYALSSATFNTTNYVLTTSSTTARVFSAPITLAGNVNLNLINVGTDVTLGLASVTGSAGSSITIEGSQTGTNSARVNLAVSGANISVPTVISGTGTALAGYVATSTNTTVTNTISNSSGFTTLIGATSGNDITLSAAAVISGSAGLQFSAGTSSGSGMITLNSASTYGGQTNFNGTASGAVKLGVDNALPTTTAVVMGFSSGNGQKLDLNGHNQTIASLASNTGGTGSITSSATGTGTDTLTINGTATTAFGLVVADGTTRKVGLTLASTNTGSQTLTAASTYSGPTNIGGGTLVLSTGSINNSLSVQVTGTGALTLGNATALADTGTLSMVSGTTLNLNAASGSETIAALILDGTSEPAGTYTVAQLNALDTTSGVSNIMFTGGNETLTITPVPEPGTVLGGIFLVGVFGWGQRRRLRGWLPNRLALA